MPTAGLFVCLSGSMQVQVGEDRTGSAYRKLEGDHFVCHLMTLSAGLLMLLFNWTVCYAHGKLGNVPKGSVIDTFIWSVLECDIFSVPL